MKENTVKLSGHAKDKFLERFFAEEDGVDAGARRRLTARAKSAFTSLRVRKAVLSAQRTLVRPRPAPPPATAAVPEPVAAPSPAAGPAPQDDAAADPYAVRLVPVFQREGREGLLAQLAAISDIGHLRRMAKTQQIILPQALRAGEAAPDVIRTAIADAIAKRIADRRAAAG